MEIHNRGSTVVNRVGNVLNSKTHFLESCFLSIREYARSLDCHHRVGFQVARVGFREGCEHLVRSIFVFNGFPRFGSLEQNVERGPCVHMET